MEQVQAQKISKEMTIGDIVERYPEVIETLLSYGVHCVGCHVSPYESLEDGFRGHGLSEEDINGAVEKLNKVVQEERQSEVKSDVPATITLSSQAVTKIKEFCEQKNKKALRVAVKAGGCSGLLYGFDLSDEADKDDQVIEQDGATVYIDTASLEKISNSVIDYNDGLTGAGFKVTNPQATSTCGCGNSFR